MKSRSFLTAYLCLTVLGGMVCAQPATAPLPAVLSAPFLYVRFNGPKGMQVSFYQAKAAARSFEMPVTVGLRPGYIYRVRLTGFARDPKLALYPTLEVRNTLSLTSRLQASDYPAPIVFNAEELENASAATSMVTKVVYLEHPDFASPVASKLDQPLEASVAPDRDPIEEARAVGRPMVILRLGERQWTDAELAGDSIANTILFPGETSLSRPRIGPMIPWACIPVYDPQHGPRYPDDECLHDGGDTKTRVGINGDGRLGGLDPSDTAAEYTDSKGRRKVAVANRVCVCVPRFAVLRAEIPLAEQATAVALGDTQSLLAKGLLRNQVPSLSNKQSNHLAGMQGKQRVTATQAGMGLDMLSKICVLDAQQLTLGPAALLGTNEAKTLTERQRTALKKQIEFAHSLNQRTGLEGVVQVEATSVVGLLAGLKVIEAHAEVRDITVCCGETPRVPEPDKPLSLCKWADKPSAQVGDVVTFTLKYTNQGGEPISEVAVSDSLTARLEYVPGSAQSDRNAVFTMQENEVGSVILRWEISGKLQAGQSGVVRFQAKIR
jgi:uncharacterized repeat protein (TIGR01451 family)